MFAYKDENGNTCVCSRADTHPDTVAIKAAPEDKLFRGTWNIVNGELVEDLAMAKEETHAKRRTKRANNFAPHDEIIMKQIPGLDAADAEVARQTIRDEDATLQTSIKNAKSVKKLRTLIKLNSL